MITVEITSTVFTVTSTVIESPVTVTADNSIFTITQVTPIFSLTAITPVITFDVAGASFDFVTNWIGPWVSGDTYARNNLVEYEYSIYVLNIDPLQQLVSTIPPPDDARWERFVWNEAPRKHLTITNFLNVGGPVSIGGNTTVTGTMAISSSTTIGGNISVGGTAQIGGATSIGGNTTISGSIDTTGGAQFGGNTISFGNLTVFGTTELKQTTRINQSLRVDQNFTVTGTVLASGTISTNGNLNASGNAVIAGTLTTNGRADIGGELHVVEQAVFDNNVSIAGNVTVGGSVGSIRGANGTFTNLVVDNQFSINGLNYPISRGLYGQVLSTNGTSTAAWTNLGDLVFWNLSSDLQTNGFNIVTGKEIGVPNPQLTIGSGETGDFKSTIILSETITDRSRGEITLNGDNLNFETPAPPNSAYNVGPRLYLNNTLGSVSLSSGELSAGGSTNLNVGVTNISIQGLTRVTGNFEIVQQSGNAWVARGRNSAGAVIGFPVGPEGIKFSDGTVLTSASVTTGTTGTFILPIATTSTLGGIRVGSRLTIDPSTGILSADIQDNTYTLPAASAGTRGGIRVGSGLAITAGDVLNVTTTTSFGFISLTQDLETNGFKIKNGSAFLDLDPVTATLTSGNNFDNTASTITLTPSSAVVSNSNIVDLQAPIVRVGSNINNSRLHVGRIYNYSGVGPPFFPAGVQFGDQTVQITAYDDGRFDLGVIEPYTSWQRMMTYLQTFDFNDPFLYWVEPDLG